MLHCPFDDVAGNPTNHNRENRQLQVVVLDSGPKNAPAWLALSRSESCLVFKSANVVSFCGVNMLYFPCEPYFKHNELPVYKIAYGRFVHVEMVNDALVFRFSEWDHQVGVGWTMHKIRDISLTTEQFLLLCSMILNGQADPVEITVSSKFFHVTSQYPCLLTVLLVSTGF